MKEKVDAPSLVTRLKYRKGVASGAGGKGKVSIQKGEKITLQHATVATME